MFCMGRCFIKLKFFYILYLLFTSSFKISYSFCNKGKQYYNSNKKLCLPCMQCISPYVVIATCQLYSDTQCGIPLFTGGTSFDVEQHQPSDKVSRNGHLRHSVKEFPKNKNLNNSRASHNDLNRQWNKNCTNISNKNCSSIDKSEHTNDSETKLPSISLPNKQNVYQRQNHEKKNKYTVNFNKTKNYKLEIVPEGNSILKEDVLNVTVNIESVKQNFFYTNLGKYTVTTAIIFINLLLIIILIVKIAKVSCRRQSKTLRYCHTYKQKLPDPSQKPIKCSFTAVLPSKSNSKYANVDSYLNTLISPVSSTNSSDSDNLCVFPPSSIVNVHENLEIENSLSLLVPHSQNQDSLERDPLTTSSQEVFENSSTIQLYSRLPNPFTMDRLLEHRKAGGSTSVENNLYVETWCSSPSPMLPRSQLSSVAPSPALSCIRRPFPSSNCSSPLTTRIFRATPGLSSFQSPSS